MHVVAEAMTIQAAPSASLSRLLSSIYSRLPDNRNIGLISDSFRMRRSTTAWGADIALNTVILYQDLPSSRLDKRFRSPELTPASE
jgi:hypothetical protein